MAQSRLVFLGTGSSVGIPVVGCSCSVCRSSDPRNQRFRSSALLEIGRKRFLIDPSPDFRMQALRAHISHLDGVLITHAHFDHIGGFDDLRVLVHNSSLPCLLSSETWELLQSQSSHLFSETSRFPMHVLRSSSGVCEFEGISVQYCSYGQSGMKVTGFRVGSFAYILDLKEYDDSVFQALQGVEAIVVSGLRPLATKAHLSIEEAITFGKTVGARRIFLSHVGHEIDFGPYSQALPEGVFLTYDGLEVLIDTA